MSAPPRRPKTSAPSSELLDGEAGALQVGPTDLGMVRFILTTDTGVVELDFGSEEAREIAREILDSADIADGASRKTR